MTAAGGQYGLARRILCTIRPVEWAYSLDLLERLPALDAALHGRHFDGIRLIAEVHQGPLCFDLKSLFPALLPNTGNLSTLDMVALLRMFSKDSVRVSRTSHAVRRMPFCFCLRLALAGWKH